MSFFEQNLRAAEMEVRVIGRLLQLEEEGVVKRVGTDGWVILDQPKYQAAMRGTY